MADQLHDPFNKLKTGLRHIVGRPDSSNSRGELLGLEKEKSSQEFATYTLNELKTKLKTGMFNILIAGRSGSGKSTLVNEIFEGDFATTSPSEPVTMETRKYTKKNVPLVIYDTRGLEMKEYDQILEELLTFVKENQEKELCQQKIHLAWLCVVEDGRRVEEAEKELARRLSKFMPVIAVITKVRRDDGFCSAVQ